MRARPNRSMLMIVGTTLASLAITGCGGAQGPEASGAETPSADEATTSSASEREVASASEAADLDRFVVGVPVNFVPTNILHLTRELGYFQEHGLEVEIVTTQDTPSGLSGVISGSLNMFSGGPDGLVANAEGADLIAVAGIANTGVWDFVAQPDIASWDDLSEGTFGIASEESIGTVATRLTMEAEGVDPSMVEMLPFGNNSGRYAALQANQVDATLLGNPVSQIASEEGYTLLPVDDPPPFSGNVFNVSRSWAEGEGREQLVSFLKAIQQATNHIYESRDDLSQIADLTAEIMETESSYTLGAWENVVENPRLLPEDLHVEEEAVRVVAETWVELGTLSEVPDLENYIDHTFLEQAQAELQ